MKRAVKDDPRFMPDRLARAIAAAARSAIEDAERLGTDTTAAKRRYTIGSIAKRCGCTRETLSAYVHGHRTPDATIAARLARELSVSADYLLGLTN